MSDYRSAFDEHMETLRRSMTDVRLCFKCGGYDDYIVGGVCIPCRKEAQLNAAGEKWLAAYRNANPAEERDHSHGYGMGTMAQMMTEED